MPKRKTRSISLPITLAIIAVVLGIAVLIGWTLVFLQNSSLPGEVSRNIWFMSAGFLSLITIMTVLVMFSIFLVREILEVRRQNSFIDSVTHELKSPLASLKLCLETSSRKEITKEQGEQLRQMMLDDIERLSVFIDDVLEASRLSHGQSGHPLSDVNLHEIVKRCIYTITRRHKIPLSSITNKIPEDFSLRTDQTSLETIIRNLLDNAVKYSNKPIAVSVNVMIDHSSNKIRIEVTDQGIGVSPKHLKRIFERFYRVPAEDVRARRGTGLGLFVVSALAKNLGGKLKAFSAGPGRGTSMRLSLPVETQQEKSTKTSAHKEFL